MQQNPEIKVSIDGKIIQPKVEKQKGVWKWVMTEMKTGQHRCHYDIIPAKSGEKWTGKVSAWLICSYHPDADHVAFTLIGKTASKPMPPNPEPAGRLKKTLKIGQLIIK